MNGILLFNKPAGWTSHDAVQFVRTRLGAKTGHAGTLDPMAAGLLLILVGQATRQSGSLSGMDKEYRGVLELGVTTDTQDLEGRIVRSEPWQHITQQQVEEAVAVVAGRSEQTPPVFSAIKRNGRALYRSARQGEVVALEPRPATVHAARLERFTAPEAEIYLRVAKGFYVRTFCHDVGVILGCGAVLACLLRTRIGAYALSQACQPADFQNIRPSDCWNRLVSRSAVQPL